MNDLFLSLPINPTILAFDTTGTQDSISLYHHGITTSKALERGGSQYQSSLLIPSLIDLLKPQNLDFKDIEFLATLSGPGSFTGIRIGLATAQGLIIAAGFQPIVPTLLELLAFVGIQKNQSYSQILSLVDSKRGDYFCQKFQNDLTPLDQPHTLSLREVQAQTLPMISDKVIDGLPDLFVSPDLIAENLVQFCLKKVLTKGRNDYQTLTPFYIRNPVYQKQKRFVE